VATLPTDTATADPQADPARDGADADVRVFDFRRPTRLGADRTRTIDLVHEGFAVQCSSALSAGLRTVASVTHDGMSETTFGTFSAELPNPTQLCLLTLEPLPGAALLHLPLSTALLFIDLLMGGRGRPVPERALTELEVGLVQQVLAPCVEELAPAWASLSSLRPRVAGMESDPEFARIGAPTDAVVVTRFTVQLTTGHPVEPATLTLCYPYAMLQPMLEGSSGFMASVGGSSGTPQVRALVAERLGQTPIELAVRFEPRKLSGLEILGLRPGDVVALPHASNAPLTVFAGNVPVLEVQPTRRGSRVAARVTRMLADPATAGRHGTGAATSTLRTEGTR
jgi:flagellar motor switch protein FliM